MASKAEFVDQTGRLLHPSKRGVIGVHELPALRKLGLDMRHWTMQVNGIGSGYWRAVGTAAELIEKVANPFDRVFERAELLCKLCMSKFFTVRV